MKKILSLLSLVTFLLLPATAFAVDGQLVSGPSGTLTNGWYSTNPTIRVNTIPGCASGPSGNVSMIIIYEEGEHQITLRSHRNEYPRIYRDDDTNGHGTSNEIFSCPSISTPYDGSDPDVFWQGKVKWDPTAPTISLATPSNNTNTDSDSVKVSGSVADSTSGVWKVVINGVMASVGGGSFTANVPVNNGLNTLTATVYDWAGNTAQAQVVVNRVQSCGVACSATSGSTSSPTAPSSGSSSPTQTQNDNNVATTQQQNAEVKNPDATMESEDNKDSTPTVVKGVVQNGGIGLATILAFVVILLVLDKFRIIEIKAFSNITNKINKNKTKTTTPKKKVN